MLESYPVRPVAGLARTNGSAAHGGEVTPDVGPALDWVKPERSAQRTRRRHLEESDLNAPRHRPGVDATSCAPLLRKVLLQVVH